MGATYDVYGAARVKPECDLPALMERLREFDICEIQDPTGADGDRWVEVHCDGASSESYDSLLEEAGAFCDSRLTVESSCSGEDAEWDLVIAGDAFEQSYQRAFMMTAVDWAILCDVASKIEDASVRDRIVKAMTET